MTDLMDGQKEAERILKVVSEILNEEKKKHESNSKNNDSRPVVSIVSNDI
jgi:hypothetical protein